jgi:two-component system, chemotaxis family, sensor kinase Cph1
MAPDRQDWRGFLLRLSHDLRASLRAVRTNAELLLQGAHKREGPEFEQLLGFLVNGARNADSLADGLTNFALALHVQRNPLPVSTGVLLRGVVAKLSAEIRGSGAEVTYDDLPRVTGDPDRLMQLFENLVRNAIQHGGDGAPRIHVSAREQGAEWIFSIRDNGPGIEAEDLERIFRPFERLKRDRGGAGLGLAICREIVAGHGGRIWAESVVGQGTTLYFTLGIG